MVSRSAALRRISQLRRRHLPHFASDGHAPTVLAAVAVPRNPRPGTGSRVADADFLSGSADPDPDPEANVNPRPGGAELDPDTHAADVSRQPLGPALRKPLSLVGNSADINPDTALYYPYTEGMVCHTMNAHDFDRKFLWRYRAQWLDQEYLDGDTFTALVDLGYGARYRADIRLLGFSAPERHQEGGPEATERLRLALGTGKTKWPLRIGSLQRPTVVSETKSLGRYVTHVLLVPDDGELVDLVKLLEATTT